MPLSLEFTPPQFVDCLDGFRSATELCLTNEGGPVVFDIHKPDAAQSLFSYLTVDPVNNPEGMRTERLSNGARDFINDASGGLYASTQELVAPGADTLVTVVVPSGDLEPHIDGFLPRVSEEPSLFHHYTALGKGAVRLARIIPGQVSELNVFMNRDPASLTGYAEDLAAYSNAIRPWKEISARQIYLRYRCFQDELLRFLAGG